MYLSLLCGLTCQFVWRRSEQPAEVKIYPFYSTGLCFKDCSNIYTLILEN